MTHRSLFILHLILTGFGSFVLAFAESAPLVVLASSLLFLVLGVFAWIRANDLIYWMSFVVAILTILSLSFFQVGHSLILFDLIYKYLTTIGLAVQFFGLIWVSGAVLDKYVQQRLKPMAHELHLLTSIVFLILVAQDPFERIIYLGIGIVAMGVQRSIVEFLISIFVFSKFMVGCFIGFEGLSCGLVSNLFFLAYFFPSSFIHCARALVNSGIVKKKIGPPT